MTTILNEHLEHFVTVNLMRCDELSSQAINVTAENGVVTLQGDISSHNGKLVAQEITTNTQGVSQVRNHLTVSMNSADAADRALLDDCRNKLAESPQLMESAIRVDVKNNTATLTGYVVRNHQIDLARDILLSVPGIENVQSYLRVNPDRVTKNHEQAVRIHDAIVGEVGMENEQIVVVVVDTTARLIGEVDETWKKLVGENIAREFQVLHVSNEIVVTPPQRKFR